MKPILFSTPMVQAILEGRKTMTRRVIKIDDAPENWQISIAGTSIVRTAPYDVKLARYKIGDILWVRETWRDRWGMAYANYGTGDAYPIDEVREIEYKASGNGFFMHGCNLCPDEPTVKWGEWSKWRPSIFMPREAARIFLRVTDVRVESVQEITHEDCRSEGFEPCDWLDEKDVFMTYWDTLNERRGYGWYANPWVWAISFERISKKEAEAVDA